VTAQQGPPGIDRIQFVSEMPGTPPGSPPVYLSLDSYFLRLWIQNDGNTRAEKVQVFLSEILRRRNSDGEFIPVESFIPMNLRWSFGSERPTHAEVFADGISPGIGVHCNLAYILKPDQRQQTRDDHPRANPEQTIMRLTTEMHPNNRCNVLLPGTYRLKLLVCADLQGTLKPDCPIRLLLRLEALPCVERDGAPAWYSQVPNRLKSTAKHPNVAYRFTPPCQIANLYGM
jgi:hypothetical protein